MRQSQRSRHPARIAAATAGRARAQPCGGIQRRVVNGEFWSATFGEADTTLANRAVPRLESCAWTFEPGIYRGGGDPRRHTLWVHAWPLRFRVMEPITGASRAAHVLGPGSVTLQRAGEYGAVAGDRTSSVCTLSISAEALLDFADGRNNRDPDVRGTFGSDDRSLSALAAACLDQADAAEPMRLEALTNDVFSHIIDRYFGHRPTASGRLAARLVERVDAYVRSHLDDAITIEALARLAGLSVYHFSRAFRAATGDTPRRYVMKARVEAAACLLADRRLSIAEITARTGFADQSHLTRWVRQVYAVTPGAIRNARLK